MPQILGAPGYTSSRLRLLSQNISNNVEFELREKYSLSMDDASVETTGMTEWKYLIKKSVKNYALRCLTKNM